MRTVEMKVPAYFTDLYKVMNHIFSLCPTRHGCMSYPNFIMTLYDAMQEGDYGAAESFTYLSCLWLKLIENGGVPSESYEGFDDCCVGFEAGLSEKTCNKVTKAVERMSVNERVDFVHNKAAELPA